MKLLISILLLTISASCTNAQESTDKNKVLIVYLSRTKNTKAVAKIIHEKVGGDLVEIEPKIPYSEDYQTNVDEVQDQNEKGILPELKDEIDISKYDTIFVGFPTWGMQLPPPIKTFLNNNDWTGKTIVPFNTNAGYGLGSSKSQIENYCFEGKITEIFSVKGGHEREGILFVMEGKKAIEVKKNIQDWLQRIGF